MIALILSNLLIRRVRTILTACAIGLSCSLVIVVTSGYASITSGAETFLSHYMGSSDAEITRPQNLVDGLVPESLATELAADPDVRQVIPRLDNSILVKDRDGKHEKTYRVIGIRREQDNRVDVLTVEKGNWFEGSDGNYAVVDQLAAEALHVDVGDSFLIPAGSKTFSMKVVGIIHKPEMFAMAMSTIYVPLRTLQRIDAAEGQVSVIFVNLKRGADLNAFAERWSQRLDQLNAKAGAVAGLKLHSLGQSRDEVESNLTAVRLATYVGSGIAMLAGTFIIFSALAMGVTERQRTLAMLRAIGATRGQIAAMVVGEGLIVSLFGSIAIGIPLGILWTHCLQWLFSGFIFFVMGVQISGSGILLAIGSAVAAALGASLLPAWTASRTSPLEAMSPLAEPPAPRPPLGWFLLGLALAGIDPILFRLPWENYFVQITPAPAVDAITNLFRFYGHFCIGIEGLFFGFFLMAPLLIWILERALAPAMAVIFRLPAALLRQQLSLGLWRSAGAAAALMCGLTLLIVMTTMGTTMLDGWRLPDKFPDLFIICLKLGGLPPDQWPVLAQTPGIRHFPDGEAELMPIAIATPGLGENPLALVGAILDPRLNSTLFCGVPPKMVFQLIQPDFRDNDGNSVPRDQQNAYAQTAERQLGTGRHVIVTEDYRRRYKVKYGDKISFFNGSTKYEYTICGIIWSPGFDVFVGLFDMGRVFDQRTAGMVFGSIDDAAQDFGVTNVNAFSANLDPGVNKNELIDRMRKRLGDVDVRAGDVRTIKANIDSDFRRLLGLLTTVAFSAMAVASLGVTNTIMTSVRARRWHLGVLRSVGLCRGELLRLVLAEAFLLGLAGTVLGLLSGAILAGDARLLGGDILGYLPPLVIPWFYICIGGTAIMIVSILAAIWPAISVARTEPLELLQAGRAAV
jgi:putative ABC transport system permease protein